LYFWELGILVALCYAGNSNFTTPEMSSIADNGNDDDDDVISSLPNTVLCHILSFIPKTQVVATSVWHSNPSLNITDV